MMTRNTFPCRGREDVSHQADVRRAFARREARSVRQYPPANESPRCTWRSIQKSRRRQNFAIAMARLPASATRMTNVEPLAMDVPSPRRRDRSGPAEAIDPLDWDESLVKRAWQRLERRGPAPLLARPPVKLHISTLVGDRLTVGQRTLTPPVLVRIQVPQPLALIHFSPFMGSIR
jgi:hypothetical protein